MMKIDKLNHILQSEYQIEADIKQLVGYEDLNYHLKTDNGQEYIFKIHHSESYPHLIQAQNDLLTNLEKSNVSHLLPHVLNTVFGSTIISLEKYGFEQKFGRLLTFLDGQLYSEVEKKFEGIAEFGKVTGLLNLALQDYEDHRFHLQSRSWNLNDTFANKELLIYVDDISIRRLIHYYLDQFKYYQFQYDQYLPQQIIHGDINDNNVLINEEALAGIFDFGDACYSYRISEIAITLTYTMMKERQILPVLVPFIQSYHHVNPLKEDELNVLYYFIAARLCTSLLNAYKNKQLQPESDYHQVSFEQAVWLIQAWEELNPFLFLNEVKTACGQSNDEDFTAEIKRKAHLGASYSLSYKSPLKIEKAALHYLYASDGQTYLDCVNNISHVGHCHPLINEAIENQIHQLNTNTRYIYESLSRYLKQLTATFPDPLKTVYLTNSGSEAGDLAQRIARTITGRNDLLVLENGYHGNTSVSIDISSYKFNRKGGQGQKDHIHILSMPDPIRGKFANADNLLQAHLDELDQLLIELEERDRLPAAFYAETILGCGGQMFLPEHYFEEVYARLKSKGILCIMDEVQVGFGRIGSHFWAFQSHHVIPDLVVIGKPMGNGHPIAGLVTSKEISEAFNNGMEFFSSFGGNPVSCEIGSAVLSVIESEQLQSNAESTGRYFLEQLHHLKEKYTLIADVRGQGLFLGIEFLDDVKPLPEVVSSIVEEMKNRNILLSIDGPDNNVIKIKPPMIFEKKHVDHVIHHLNEVLSAAKI